MACDGTPLRVVVSGIKKGPVRRRGNGTVEEDELCWFFQNAGCKVLNVMLVMETKRADRSRGLGFVDFEDTVSLGVALKLDNKEAEGLTGNPGKLRIKRAHVATDDSGQRGQDLSDASEKRRRDLWEARDATEEMERNLALQEVRLNELVRELKQKRELPNLALSPGLQLQKEKLRQAALRPVVETMRDVWQRIHTALEEDQEEDDTAKKATVTRAHGEQPQCQKDKSFVCKDSSATSVFLQRDKLSPLASTKEAPQQHGCATKGIRANV